MISELLDDCVLLPLELFNGVFLFDCWVFVSLGAGGLAGAVYSVLLVIF